MRSLETLIEQKVLHGAEATDYGAALASQLGQATLQLLQKNLNIKPTLEIRPGYQFNVIVTKEIVLQQPYKTGR